MSKKFHGMKLRRVRKNWYHEHRLFDRDIHEDDLIFEREYRKRNNISWPNRFRKRTHWKVLKQEEIRSVKLYVEKIYEE